MQKTKNLRSIFPLGGKDECSFPLNGKKVTISREASFFNCFRASKKPLRF